MSNEDNFSTVIRNLENGVENGEYSYIPMKNYIDLIPSDESEIPIKNEWLRYLDEKRFESVDINSMEDINPQPLFGNHDTKKEDNDLMKMFDEDEFLGVIHNSTREISTEGETRVENNERQIILPPPPLPQKSSIKKENLETGDVLIISSTKDPKKKKKKKKRNFNPPRKRKRTPKLEQSEKNIKHSKSTYNTIVDQPPPPSFPPRKNSGFVSASKASSIYGKQDEKRRPNHNRGGYSNRGGRNNRSSRSNNNYNGYGKFDPVDNLKRNVFNNNNNRRYDEDEDEEDDDFEETETPPKKIFSKKRKRFQVPKKRDDNDRKKKKRKIGGKKKDGLLSDNLIKLLGSEEIPEELSHLEIAMMDRVANEVIVRDLKTSFSDISGLEHAKKAVFEVVIYPLSSRSKLFTGLRAPGHVLLYGPPGTGKTMIGRAIAGSTKATFFSISASSLMSKWVGEGERLVRAMFELAGFLAPSIIFIDEIDSLLGRRGSGDSSSGVRRMKTEFLVQLDGANSKKEGAGPVVVIGATNLPQEIDDAFVRRMSKRLYVPLPLPEARGQIFRHLMKTGNVEFRVTDEELKEVIDLTNGYSGSDISLIMSKSAYIPVQEYVSQNGDEEMLNGGEFQVRPCILKDIIQAIRVVRPSVDPKSLKEYEDWNKKFGAN